MTLRLTVLYYHQRLAIGQAYQIDQLHIWAVTWLYEGQTVAAEFVVGDTAPAEAAVRLAIRTTLTKKRGKPSCCINKLDSCREITACFPKRTTGNFSSGNAIHPKSILYQGIFFLCSFILLWRTHYAKLLLRRKICGVIMSGLYVILVCYRRLST